MKVKNLSSYGWRAALNAARTTVNKEPLDKEPSEAFKIDMVCSEHSPLREVVYSWTWTNLKYWVHVHLVRHWVGVLSKYISTNRTDRTGKTERGSQDAEVTFSMTVNAQALINISRVRLCAKASPETREAWRAVINQTESVIRGACVPNCIYRGFCPEKEPCAYNRTPKQSKDRVNYIRHLKPNETYSDIRI